MKLLTTILVAAIGLNTLAQTTTTRNWIHTQETYSDSIGNSINVTNSFPKGGATYTNIGGHTYSYVIFWHRITNTSKVPLDLVLEFPPKPFTIFPSPNSHIRLFLPNENMTTEKIELFDYGLSNLKGFLDTSFYEPKRLEKTLNPNEDYLFYVSVLIYHAQGSARASLVWQGSNMVYKIKINPDSAVIPCGQITFKH